jgi:hypothetical protein
LLRSAIGAPIIISLKPSLFISPAALTELPLLPETANDSPYIANPWLEVKLNKSISTGRSLPYITYDVPAADLELGSAYGDPIIMSE